MQKKREASYSLEDEAKAKGWLEAVTGEEIIGDFWEFLHDGSYLCRLINKLEPGTVNKKLETPSTAPFKQMEAVGAFIEGCKKYGLTEKDCCVTLDIYEKQAGDQNMALSTIIALGRKAQKKGFAGPTLGPKEADPNPRDFDEQQQKEGRNVIGLQMGTNQVASQAGMTAYGQQRQIYDPKAT